MNQPIITSKTIFISGGVGSIGSQIVEHLLENYSPKVIRIFDNSEEKLFYAMGKYHNDKRIRILLGDIRDKERINWALRGVNTVFHAAALKHVFINEYNPFEPVKTNVLGTQNIIEAALINNIDTFINISTDKAVNPTSVMGATKLLGERLTSSAKYFRGDLRTKFLSVRFGNVLNTSGSVIPIFIKQLKNNQPITITDKRMVRYFMTVGDAIKLILKAATISKGGEVFILKMSALKIIDLAEVIIEKFSTINRIKDKIEIQEIGKKVGEKINEELMSPIEAEQALELKDMYIIPPYQYDQNGVFRYDQNIYQFYTSKYKAVPVSYKRILIPKILTKEEIKKLLDSLDLFID